MSTITAWPSQVETWLDERGKGAWIAAMVLGFIFFWPVGLALLAYMIWSKRMFSHACGRSRHLSHARKHNFRSSGNTAFDAYKADTIDRLEREQTEFEDFLRRLRDSKDKAEFDQYMEDRARAARDSGDSGDSDDSDEDGDTRAAKPKGSGAY